MNHVQAGSFLTLHYRLSGPDGADLINTFDDKPATLSLGSGQLSPAIERRLIGLEEGSRTTLSLAPGEAFGQRSPELLQRVSRAMLREHGDPDEHYAVGDVVQRAFAAGLQHPDLHLDNVLCRLVDGVVQVVLVDHGAAAPQAVSTARAACRSGGRRSAGV